MIEQTIAIYTVLEDGQFRTNNQIADLVMQETGIRPDRRTVSNNLFEWEIAGYIESIKDDHHQNRLLHRRIR